MLEPGEALMLFDGLCNFCSGSVRWIAERSRGRALRFCAMQTGPGEAWLRRLGRPIGDPETFILVDPAGAWVKSDAALRVGALLDAPWPRLATLARGIPRPWRDWVYDRIAANRFTIAGRRDQCFIPEPWLRARFLE
jgi:predicted DCC family thiol-disulfide oxidoreductase YuxK